MRNKKDGTLSSYLGFVAVLLDMYPYLLPNSMFEQNSICYVPELTVPTAYLLTTTILQALFTFFIITHIVRHFISYYIKQFKSIAIRSFMGFYRFSYFMAFFRFVPLRQSLDYEVQLNVSCPPSNQLLGSNWYLLLTYTCSQI